MRFADATVVVTYHNEPLDILVRALDSVWAQITRPDRILVIDDGSDTPIPEGREEGFSPKGGIEVVRVTNRGLPAARNTGLMLCETEAILFLDADDWIAQDYLFKTLPLLQAGADVVLTGLQEHGLVRQGTYYPGYDKPFDQVTLADMIQMNRFYYCSLIRTQTLKECGGYNTLMAGPWGRGGGMEDQDLWIDLMKRGATFREVREVLFHYDTSNPQSMAHTMNQALLREEIARHHRL